MTGKYPTIIWKAKGVCHDQLTQQEEGETPSNNLETHKIKRNQKQKKTKTSLSCFSLEMPVRLIKRNIPNKMSELYVFVYSEDLMGQRLIVSFLNKNWKCV